MNERLSLQDLIDLLAKKQEITKKDAEAFLRELIAIISENIESNEPVKIKDFGTFKLVKVNARKSVDVNTGEAIEIAAHYKLSFTPDKSLKEAINRPFAHFESVVLEDGVSFENIDKEETVFEGVEVEDIPLSEETVDPVSTFPAVMLEVEKELASEPENTEDNSIEDIKEDIIVSQEEMQPPVEVTDEIIEEEVAEYISTPDSKPENDAIQEGSIISEEDTQSELEVAQNETENEVTQPLADIPDEWDVQYELEEQKRASKRRRRLISLGFFIFLIVAGFLIGGLYFQEIAKYLTDGPVDGNKTTALDRKEDIKQPDTNILPVDSLSKAQEQDSVSVPTSTVLTKPEEINITEQPVSTTPAVNANTPLANVTIEPGSTLRNIALKYYGHKSFCVYIYEENKGKIKNINNIPLGTKIVIPAPAKYGIDAKDKSSVDKAKEKESKLYREMGL